MIHATEAAHAAVQTERGRQAIHLSLPSGEVKSWHLPARASDSDIDAIMREFIAEVGDAPIACFDADALADLLSRPQVLPLARKVLGRLRNLRDLALVWLPTQERFTLSALAPECEDTDAPDCLARTKAVHQQITDAIEEAPPKLLELLKPLLAHDAGFSWLPWPDTGGGTYALAGINAVLSRRPATRKREPSESGVNGDIRDVSMAFLSPGGLMEVAHPSYEHRAGQVDMAGEVAEALREGRYLVVEAGTGVGKSLAYLIPAVLWARREGEPVIVSTNTKNLQEQLIYKDLPLLQEALPVDFEAALLKGRGNYVCIRALVTAATDAANSLLASERLAAAHVISWLAQSEVGEVAEVSQHAQELLTELPRLLGRVRSQAASCLGRGCSHVDSCPVQIARAWARRADIVVSNHALTFEDTKAQILPKYSRLIFDEAQNIETVATENLSLEFSRYGVSQLLRLLTERPSGFIATMERRLETVDAPGVDDAVAALANLRPAAEEFEAAAGEFGELLADFCFSASSDPRGGTDRATVRLMDQVRQLDEWGEVVSLGQATLEAGRALQSAVAQFGARLGEIDKGGAPAAEGLDLDAEAMRQRIDDGLASLTTVLQSGDGEHYVTWADAWSARRGGTSWSLHAAPVDIGPVLASALYAHKESVIFTSATLSVDGRFDYFRQRVGLDNFHERLAEVSVPSPFRLSDQLLLCVPSDIPDPSEPGFADAVISAIGQICEVTQGGTLILFTARARMTRAFKQLEDDLRAMELTPLCQEVAGDRTALLERLKTDDRAVLFGLKSFWEGVDVPGDALRCVVICKLPFAVPSDPIIQARQEDVARKGLNPMNDYYIPEAIVGFKQGFGRLIRTTTDTGVVFVLDRRVLTKSYGRRFFQSIQRCELAREPLEDCIARAGGWLGTR